MFGAGSTAFGGFGQTPNTGSNNNVANQATAGSFGGFGSANNNGASIFGQSQQSLPGSGSFGKSEPGLKYPEVDSARWFW